MISIRLVRAKSRSSVTGLNDNSSSLSVASLDNVVILLLTKRMHVNTSSLIDRLSKVDHREIIVVRVVRPGRI